MRNFITSACGRLICVKIALLLTLSFLIPDFASARILNRNDLRKLGFAGVYRGTASGGGQFLNNAGTAFIPYGVNRTDVVRIPIPLRVAQVSGNHGLYQLTHFNANGSDRRLTIRSTYTGGTLNAFHGQTLGAGSKTYTIRKVGSSSRPSFVMTYRDNLSEFQTIGGFRLAFWTINGSLRK